MPTVIEKMDLEAINDFVMLLLFISRHSWYHEHGSLLWAKATQNAMNMFPRGVNCIHK